MHLRYSYRPNTNPHLLTRQRRWSVLSTSMIRTRARFFQSLQRDVDEGHALFKTLCEKAEQAVSFLDDSGACKMEREVQESRSRLEELGLGLRAEHGATEKSTVLYKEFQERYKTQLQWLRETRALLGSSAEPKAELYQRKAQLAKYKVKKEKKKLFV